MKPCASTAALSSPGCWPWGG